MKKYFLNNGGDNLGPFSKEELKGQKINNDTLVWSEEMDDWKNASQIDELKPFLSVTPPRIIKTKKNNLVKYLLIGVALTGFITIGSNIISNNDRNQEINQYADDEIKREIRNNIASLIKVNTNKYSVDTFGGISNLDVIVTNNTNYSIDQVIISIDYIKQNNGIYKTETLTFNNIPPNQNKSLSAPDSNRGLSVNLTKQKISASELSLCFDKNITPAIGDPDPYKCN